MIKKCKVLKQFATTVIQYGDKTIQMPLAEGMTVGDFVYVYNDGKYYKYVSEKDYSDYMKANSKKKPDKNKKKTTETELVEDVVVTDVLADKESE